MNGLVLMVLLCLVAGPLPYIGVEPTQGVKPELQVTVHQAWFIENQTSQCAVNQTVVWSHPRCEAWTRYDAGNWTLAYHMRILWLPEMDYLPATVVERPIRYTVNVTVTLQKLDAVFTSIGWEVAAVDEQVGVLFAESGSLSSWNQTARVTRLLRFTTPEYPVDGEVWPDAWIWRFYIFGAVILFVLGLVEVASYVQKRKSAASPSHAA
jgi:hypothetical protein